VTLKKSPISIISLICFQLNLLEIGITDSSSEAHLKSSKTSRDSYLELELSIFVKIFEFLSSGRPVPLKLQKWSNSFLGG